MAHRTKYLFIASMDVDPDKAALFNDVYDTEHCPELSKVPGVGLITRFEKQNFSVLIGGQTQTVVLESEPTFHAMYELDSPDVLTSNRWGEAVELARWPEQVRPYTKNRRHVLLKMTYPEGLSDNAKAQQSKYLFIASMDVDAEKTSLFNDVYDTEHCPELSKVPGVGPITRFEKQNFSVLIGGQTQTVVLESEPTFHAMYELDSPDVLTSNRWGEAVELGRWPEQVRPYTKNRRHVLLKLTYPQG